MYCSCVHYIQVCEGGKLVAKSMKKVPANAPKPDRGEGKLIPINYCSNVLYALIISPPPPGKMTNGDWGEQY